MIVGRLTVLNRVVSIINETEVGRKYIKIVQYLVVGGVRERGNSVWMFVNNKTGECLKPASWKAPAKGVRFMIDFLHK